MPTPDLAAVEEYLGQAADTYTDAVLTRALSAETKAQTRVCRVGDPMEDDLAEALLRRVARNLAMGRLPLGVQADALGGTTRLGSTDPEVRRLEGPFRKVIAG